MPSSNLPSIDTPERAFYGIQFRDTPFRHWENKSENQSTLYYDFQEIDIDSGRSLQNLLIAVTRAFPNALEREIKQIAKTIQQIEKIEEYDPIFAVESQSIRKFGYISAKEGNNRKVTLDIEWVKEDDKGFGFVQGNIFNEDAELQILTSRQFETIQSQYTEALLLGYQQMPPMVFDDGYAYGNGSSSDVDYERGLEKAYLNDQQALKEAKNDQGGTVHLFYGTNRNTISHSELGNAYGNVETAELKYGICEVHIPRDHKQGKLERQGKMAQLFHWPANEKRHFIVNAILEMDLKDFFRSFVEELGNKSRKQALLFVHGYANTFEDAAYRAAQFAWDLPFKGLTGFYSWPSTGTKTAYGNDEAAARSSAPFLKEFIRHLISVNELEQLHIIAHSMGGLILTLSLNILTGEIAGHPDMDKICQLVLGAPDIDKREFFNTILPEFKKLGQQRTLYASDHDNALKWSSSLRSLRDRLGQIGTSIFTAHGLDTVNASNVTAPNDHSYVFQGKDILGDLFQVINNGSLPEDRRLREIKNTPLNYWLFPK
jgi:esterase/lipase superfamily enzyme